MTISAMPRASIAAPQSRPRARRETPTNAIPAPIHGSGTLMAMTSHRNKPGEPGP